MHLLVGIQGNLAVGAIDQPYWQLHLQFATAGLGHLATDEASPQHMEFSLAHRALEPQEQSVVEVAGVVEAFLVEDESPGQSADLQQPVPVHRAAGQAGDLQAQHHSHLTHTYGRHQLLEALAVAIGTGPAQVGVNDHDALQRPAQGNGAFP